MSQHAVTEKCSCGAAIVYAGDMPLSVLGAWRADHRHGAPTKALDPDHPQAYTYRHECDLPHGPSHPLEYHCPECGRDWTHGRIERPGLSTTGWTSQPLEDPGD